MRSKAKSFAHSLSDSFQKKCRTLFNVCTHLCSGSSVSAPRFDALGIIGPDDL
jgi:hypothetical protein